MNIDRLLKEQYERFDRKIVVLDDDPTGTQTVHDIYVYTDWTPETLLEAFSSENKLFYILTNSRSFTAAQTEKVHRDIAAAIRGASEQTGKDYIVISRSDSTLRGHYPLETEVLRDALGKDIDGEVLCPFFPEGGRYTIGDIHYVKQGDDLVPAAETEFAKDATFGYTKSDLKEYVEEKTCGAYKAADVISIGLDELRAQDVDTVAEKLLSVRDFGKIVVNSENYEDLKFFCYALYLAMGEGRHYMFRSAAGLVKTLGCIDTKPYLTRGQLVTDAKDKGGLILIGSHMKKTTAQLEELKKIPGIDFIGFDSDLVLDPQAFAVEIARVQEKIDADIDAGTTVCVYTKRKVLLLENDTKEAALLRSVAISDAVQSFAANLKTKPAFIIAKGGITSSDVGVKALKVKKALVLGQAAAGIPVWQTGPESRFPGLSYVIFPGNVGTETTLREIVEQLIV
ncbi:MAG: hydroxyacid dehydrogenase [Firmicutes bacterium]|nr:hydroxyacid dehydrogenase [Bacillota bacterium]